jgi:hypothetical protein
MIKRKKEKGQRDKQNTIQKTEDRATGPHLKPGVTSGVPEG